MSGHAIPGTITRGRNPTDPASIVRPLLFRLSLIVFLAGLGLAATGAALVPAAVGFSRAGSSVRR